MRPMPLFAALLTLAGCAASGPSLPLSGVAIQPNPTPGKVVSACTPQTVLNEGRETRQYPVNCPPADPLLRDRYALGREIARLEEELREVDYLTASSDSRSLFGGGGVLAPPQGFLIQRRAELKRALITLERQAARP